MKKNATVVLFILLSFASTSYTQNRSLQAGIRVMNEFTFFDGLAPGFGGQVVYRMTKHSGLESGIYYQSRRIHYTIEVISGGSSATYQTSVAERRIQFPILYRFDSKVINFVVGPSMDFFIGWKDKSTNPDIKITDYDRDPVSFGFNLGISKSINLSPTLILEPEVKLNLITTDSDGGVGLNIGLRKIIF
jgi:hypothetical protein